jgi:hypothetical protein
LAIATQPSVVAKEGNPITVTIASSLEELAAIESISPQANALDV